MTIRFQNLKRDTMLPYQLKNKVEARKEKSYELKLRKAQ
jgi:hypothetical protein